MSRWGVGWVPQSLVGPRPEYVDTSTAAQVSGPLPFAHPRPGAAASPHRLATGVPPLMHPDHPHLSLKLTINSQTN